MQLCLDVSKHFSTWSDVFGVKSVVEMNDVFVWRIFVDVDCVERRSDVCQVFWDLNDDDESGSDGGNVVVVVGIHLEEEDGWEWAERLELVAVHGVEDDFCCALGSCPHKPAYWMRPYPSSAASSPLD
jgi:hypothetical protein